MAIIRVLATNCILDGIQDDDDRHRVNVYAVSGTNPELCIAYLIFIAILNSNYH